MRTLLTVTLNRRMLRGNWSSIRGAAPVGLGALGGHDARLQRLAGWLASSLAYSLCMLFSFHLSCILMIFLLSGSPGQEEGGWWRKHSNCCWCQKAGRRCQLLIIGRGGAFFHKFWSKFICRWTHSTSREWKTSNPPIKSFFRSRSNFTRRYGSKYLPQVCMLFEHWYWSHLLQITEKLQETLRMYDQCWNDELKFLSLQPTTETNKCPEV